MPALQRTCPSRTTIPYRSHPAVGGTTAVPSSRGDHPADLHRPAEQSDHDRLVSAVESRLDDLGSPPDGLMLHVGYPQGRGFMIIEAWRSEDLFRSYFDQLFLPALSEAGLVAGEAEIGPAWSIARP